MNKNAKMNRNNIESSVMNHEMDIFLLRLFKRRIKFQSLYARACMYVCVCVSV